ncbi:hypothetical protein BLNAU_12753 [Blattamonas nauphoetae]|uniref:Uncharacterized protein n=1 Tax=Blattamonas nauphoetae TaxID=2049346 RepID=A0ABQ9XIV0_9EUKA|nr:hypothetical protein BLNAU_12753 [Blattamonas nauphoetae]
MISPSELNTLPPSKINIEDSTTHTSTELSIHPTQAPYTDHIVQTNTAQPSIAASLAYYSYVSQSDNAQLAAPMAAQTDQQVVGTDDPHTPTADHQLSGPKTEQTQMTPINPFLLQGVNTAMYSNQGFMGATPRLSNVGFVDGMSDMTPDIHMRNSFYDESYLLSQGMPQLDADAMYLLGVTQRVEPGEPGPDNNWEGEECTDLLPGKHGGYIVTALHRRFRILLTVHDSRIGSCFLLNRGDGNANQGEEKSHRSVVPNRFRSAVTYLHRYFVCEYENRKYYVQACETGARVFNGTTPTSAWTNALKFYCPHRKNPRLAGPLYFGLALRPIQEACPGMVYVARKKGSRTTTQRMGDDDEQDEDMTSTGGRMSDYPMYAQDVLDGDVEGKDNQNGLSNSQALLQQQMYQQQCLQWQFYNMQAAQQYRQQTMQSEQQKKEEGEKETKTE